MDQFSDKELTTIELEMELACKYYTVGTDTYRNMQEIITKIREERIRRIVAKRYRGE